MAARGGLLREGRRGSGRARGAGAVAPSVAVAPGGSGPVLSGPAHAPQARTSRAQAASFGHEATVPTRFWRPQLLDLPVHWAVPPEGKGGGRSRGQKALLSLRGANVGPCLGGHLCTDRPRAGAEHHLQSTGLPAGSPDGTLTVWPQSGRLRQNANGRRTSLVRQTVGTGCHLHTSTCWADSSRASLTRVHRQAYARLYPVLLVREDGSTIHIRYREPRRMLMMPVDLDSLTPEERRARFRKREAQFQKKKVEEPQLADDFDQERYKQFWTKK